MRRIVLALILCLATPAVAQDATGLAAIEIDPETATQLVTLGGALRESCSRGRRDACELNEQLTELSDVIVAGRSACLAGSQRGCTLAERASERVGELYERLSR